MYTHLLIHELLSNQVGSISEIADFRNESVHLSESKIVPNQKGLIAVDFIPKDTVIFSYRNKVTNLRTRTSIQVGVNEHLEAGDFGSFTNHSCNQNAFVWSSLRNEGTEGHVVLIAKNDIQIGEEITFDYATTESKLTKELLGTACACKSENCRNSIQGFYALPFQIRGELISNNLIANYLKQEQVVPVYNV